LNLIDAHHHRIVFKKTSSTAFLLLNQPPFLFYQGILIMPLSFGSDTAPLTDALLPSSNVGLSWYNLNRKRLKKFARQYLAENPSAVRILTSQGEVDTTIPAVQTTRASFTELRTRLPVLNQYYTYSHDPNILQHIKNIVMTWVRTNEPTGKPIDETNFEGLLRVLTTRWTDFSVGEQYDITAWLNALKTAKESWSFSPLNGEGSIQYGNHYTHHYKILLKVYSLLGLSTTRTNLINTITAFKAVNFPYGNSAVLYPSGGAPYNPSIHHMPRGAVHLGESIDYIRRDALHYHVYTLEPWLEIALDVGGTLFESVVDNAFLFLTMMTLTPPIKHYEFAHTTDPFDALRRAASNPDYLAPNAMFNIDKVARVVFSYQYYKQQLNSTFSVDDRLLSFALRSRYLPSVWYYYFRMVFSGAYG
jgi:hypothetical protein